MVGPTPAINGAALEQFALIVSHRGTGLYFLRNMATLPDLDFDLFVSTRVRGDSR